MGPHQASELALMVMMMMMMHIEQRRVASDRHIEYRIESNRHMSSNLDLLVKFYCRIASIRHVKHRIESDRHMAYIEDEIESCRTVGSKKIP